MPADLLLTVEVPPVALLPGDVLRCDPDAPGRKVWWRIGKVGWEGDIRTADYVTDDGTEGRHGFEDARQLLTVEAGHPSRAAA